MAATRTIYKRGRHYVWPVKAPHELEVPSVTTIMSNGIPKPALAPWNAKMVATYAAENIDAWRDLPMADAIDLLKRSPFRMVQKRANEGSLVHAALDAYATDSDVVPVPKDKPLKAQYDGALQFLRDFKVKVLHAEATVFSRTHKYAGTSDVFGEVMLPDEARDMFGGVDHGVAVIDYKTGKAIYDDHVIQANAYASGDFIAEHDGTETPVPAIDFLIIVRPKRRGGYEAKIYEPSQAMLEVFLAAKTVSEREDRVASAEVGRVLTGPEDE